MKRLTPCLAIKKFCNECAGGFNDARDCTANPEDIAKMVKKADQDDYRPCPLYPYRLGKRPLSTGKDTQGQRKPILRAKKATFNQAE